MRMSSSFHQEVMNRWCRNALILAGIGLIIACQPAPDSPPNIVLFLVDDLGWQDTSVPFWSDTTHFNRRYRTPNMERLAAEGMKFTSAYATSVCSPTRVSLITGMNAARHRVTNWTLRKDQQSVRDDDLLAQPKWNVNGLSPEPGIPLTVHATPLPQLLKDAGYRTIHVGKAHFGAMDTPGADPIQLGFDVNIAGHAAGAPGSYFGLNNFGNGQEGREVWAVPGLDQYHGKDVFLTEALTKEALQAVDVRIREEKPFFLYLSHYAVHTPIQGDPRFLQKYLDAGLDSIEAKYATLVEGMDKSLGDVLDYLEEKNLTNNTIILFMSDNGGLSAVGRGGTKHTHNRPLSSGKGSAREGGIRVPMIVRWTGVTAEGSTSSVPVIIEDFFPSILQMAGIREFSTVQSIDGRSFIPLLEGQPGDPDRRLIWHYPNRWGPTGPGIGSYSAIRKGNWKLIYYHADRSFELFDLANDIGEKNNLYQHHPEKVKEMAEYLNEYLVVTKAQMPTDKKTGKPIGLPVEQVDGVPGD